MDYILIADTLEKYQKGDSIQAQDVTRFIARYPYAIADADGNPPTAEVIATAQETIDYPGITPQDGEADEH